MLRVLTLMVLFGIWIFPVAASAQERKSTPGDPVKGKVVFQDRCEMCHDPNSEDAKVGPGLKGLYQMPPHKMADGTEHKKHTAAIIRDQIVKGSQTMPPMGDSLSEAEIDDVLAYLQTL